MSAHRRVFSLLEPYIGSRVFEVGCGTGTLTQLLLERADLVFGIEPDEACRGRLFEAVGHHPRFIFKPWRLAECNVELLLSQAFDTAVCVGELEHIEDDVSAMKLLGAVVAAQAGRIVLLVPAQLGAGNGSLLARRASSRLAEAVRKRPQPSPEAAMTSAHASTHASPNCQRRYTRRSLAELIERAGLAPRVIRYTNLIGLLGWYYQLIFPAASRVEEVIGSPLGLSLFAVADSGLMARKPVTVAAGRPVAAPG